MPVHASVESQIGIVTLDRPEKLNALDVQHLHEMRDHLVRLSTNPEVRVIVLTGSGERAFCTGADLTSSAGQDAGIAEAFGLELSEAARRGLYIRLFDLSPLQVRKPLIAAVNGYCLGGGLELALQCDLIVASENAALGMPEVLVGSLPGAGGIPSLLRAIPRAIAMHLLLTGERIAARRAHDIGLVSDVWPMDAFRQATLDLAARIAANGPLAAQMIKMLALQSSGMGPSEILQISELAWGLIRDTEDRREGRRAFIEKRKPRYLGR